MRRVLNLMAVLVVAAVMLPAPAAAQAAVSATPEEKLLQFTAAGHMLAFSAGSVIVASARHMLRVEFAGARPVAPQADDGGSEAETGAMAAPLGKVTYKNLWDGVDLVYEADEGAIARSTYYLEDGTTAKNIRLCYNRPVQLDDSGNLLIVFDTGVMIDSAPIAWQETKAGRQPVQISYTLNNERELGFSLGDCLPGLPVVIDPWLTFLGGGADDGRGIAMDASGNVYVTGYSNATWQGTNPPVRAYTLSYDAFAAKLDPSGNLIWNTFLGGNGNDYGYGIAVDASGSVYVSGDSDATWQGTNPPVRAYDSSYDAFAAKLNSSGALTWNTFLGGSGLDEGHEIAVDASGNVYVSGQSNADWGSPVRAYTLPGYDAFAAKLNSSGVLTWNTFLGGAGQDRGYGIAVDASGNVCVAGDSDATWGSPKRAYHWNMDAFAARLDSSGNLTWNTFLGGGGYDTGSGIAMDTSGNVYVAGISDIAWGSPMRHYTSDEDAFAAKLNSSGELTWNTFLGGSGTDHGYGVAVDATGNACVAGYSTTTWGSPVRAYTSGTDAFAARLNSSGALTWNTFLGGGGYDTGNAIAVDGSGNVCVAGYSNATWGSPVRVYSSSLDAFAVQLAGNGELRVYTVTYNGNGNTSGMAPADQIKTHDVSLTLRTNTGGLARDGYTFSSWNTTADGTGIDYAGGAAYTTNAAVTLYAKWARSVIGTNVPHGGSAPAAAFTAGPPVSLPNIRVQSASLSAAAVTPGAPVTVTASLTNSGTVNGNKKVTVYVNGQVETAQGVTVNSGGSSQLTFNVSRNEPGEYTVYVDGVPAGNFRVELFKESDLILLFGITMLAVAFVISMVMLRRRQQGY